VHHFKQKSSQGEAQSKKPFGNPQVSGETIRGGSGKQITGGKNNHPKGEKMLFQEPEGTEGREQGRRARIC